MYTRQRCFELARASAVALALALGTLNCGSDPAPDRLEIARLVQNADDFRRPKSVTLRRAYSGTCQAGLAAIENWRQLRDLGVIELRAATNQGAEVCAAELTEAVRREVAQIAGAASPESDSATTTELPVAVRNSIRVLEVAPEKESVDVRLAWHWRPNPIGRKLGVDAQLRTSRAALWLYRDGWRLVRLDLRD